MRFARCAACDRWLGEDKVTVLGCPACFFQTARCSKCGGLDGAVRSLFSHFGYWSGTRGNQIGGHTRRLSEWASYTSALQKMKETLGLTDEAGQ